MKGKKNPLLAKMAAERDYCFSEGIKVGIQYNNDLYHMVLHDPDIMGKDTFGPARLEKIHNAAQELGETLADALDARKPEADWCRAKMDAALRRIWKDRLLPFSKRYCQLTEVRYGKKR